MHKNPTKDCRFAFANKSNVAASYIHHVSIIKTQNLGGEKVYLKFLGLYLDFRVYNVSLVHSPPRFQSILDHPTQPPPRR